MTRDTARTLEHKRQRVAPPPGACETDELSDTWRFFRSWITNPGRVSAIAPSGQALAQLMTREITRDHGPVLELGPGTGVFTRALLAQGVAEDDLTLVEYGPEFIPDLQRRFPKAALHQFDATKLSDMPLPRRPGAVVSGLPLLSMSDAQTHGILKGAFQHLTEGGSFYQFTYGPRCPVPQAVKDDLKLTSTKVGRTFRNLPPATVYRLTRHHR